LLSADEIAGPLRSTLSQRNVEVLLDNVIGVDALKVTVLAMLPKPPAKDN
jgi:hypothetical protein